MSNGMRVIAPFDLSSTSPLDSRQKWPSYDALEHNTTVKMPNGFHAYCVAEDKWYQLSCTDENSIATYLWFADNMFGDTEQSTLTANTTAISGLNDRIDAVDEDITSIEQTLITKVDSDKIGAASGITPLDANQMIPIQYIPHSVIEKMKIVADDAARFALTKAEVQNGDTVKVETTIVEGEVITGLMYYVYDDNHLDNESGYRQYTAGMATTAYYAETAPATGVSFTDESYSSTTVAAALVEVMAEKDALEETVTEMLAGKASTAVATTVDNGLMSSEDKVKLNGVADNANNYSLPTASASTLGGMKVGDGLKIDTGGILSLNARFVGTQAEWEAFDKTDFPDKGIVIITDD